MRIRKWTNPKLTAEGKDIAVYQVDLAKGERHTWHKFMSINAGHVLLLIDKVNVYSDWNEYDPNQDMFLARLKLMEMKGWKAEDVDEVPLD